MNRRVIVVSILAGLVTSGSADLSACGDKFLRVGRSERYRGYAAVHPASILIYTPVNAKPTGIKELEELLKRAGHTPVAVKNGTSLSQTFDSARYDLVIAAYADAEKVKQQLQSIPSKPDVLPILDKPTKAVVAEAGKSYPFVLDTRAMNKFDALAQIDHLMSQRLKATHAAAPVN
jgi:hypothetical protein